MNQRVLLEQKNRLTTIVGTGGKCYVCLHAELRNALEPGKVVLQLVKIYCQNYACLSPTSGSHLNHNLHNSVR